MHLKQLEYFVRVAELGSFTRAAGALGIAQPALSRQIRLIEVELRQNLLIRNGRGAVPTEAGSLLLTHGRGILHQVQLAREALSTGRDALAGRVSVGLPPSLSRLVTVQLVRAFKARLPQAQLTLTEGFSVLMQEGLRVGSLDMAVLYNAAPSLEVEVKPLHIEELVLISKKTRSAGTSPVTLPALAALPLILPSRPNAFRMLLDLEMSALSISPNITLEVDGLNAILSLVKEGLGNAVLPSYTLSNLNDRAQFNLRRIRSPRITSTLSLVRAARRPTTQTQDIAFKIIADVVKKAVNACT